MTTNDTPLLGAYLQNGTTAMPGGPILFFALVVVPSRHKVTGTAHGKADDVNR